jgi:hypothetical protein
MAWAQRSEGAGYFIAEAQRYLYKGLGLRPAQKCAGCTSLIAGEGVIVKRQRYCSIDCVREARQAKDVPGHYLG